MDSSSVTNSATGIASHTPVTPQMAGSVRSDSRIKTKVLVKDMTAEVFPSESAVKRADEKMLYPLNKKVTQNTEKPLTARS